MLIPTTYQSAPHCVDAALTLTHYHTYTNCLGSCGCCFTVEHLYDYHRFNPSQGRELLGLPARADPNGMIPVAAECSPGDAYANHGRLNATVRSTFLTDCLTTVLTTITLL